MVEIAQSKHWRRFQDFFRNCEAVQNGGSAVEEKSFQVQALGQFMAFQLPFLGLLIRPS
jgi:hypothetical protein